MCQVSYLLLKFFTDLNCSTTTELFSSFFDRLRLWPTTLIVLREINIFIDLTKLAVSSYLSTYKILHRLKLLGYHWMILQTVFDRPRLGPTSPIVLREINIIIELTKLGVSSYLSTSKILHIKSFCFLIDFCQCFFFE